MESTTCQHEWHEEGDESGCLHEEFCNILNEIKVQPNASERLAIVQGVLRAVASEGTRNHLDVLRDFSQAATEYARHPETSETGRNAAMILLRRISSEGHEVLKQAA